MVTRNIEKLDSIGDGRHAGVRLNEARQTWKTGLDRAIAEKVCADARRVSGDRSLLGRIMETFVVGELRKQLSWTAPHTSLYHFRTATGSEADVVLEQADGSVAGVEIKAGATVTASDFAALQALRDQLGKRFKAGIVLYLGDHVVPFGDKLWLAPVSALWVP
jgi:predicted AAA+ superfamily ATPase